MLPLLRVLATVLAACALVAPAVAAPDDDAPLAERLSGAWRSVGEDDPLEVTLLRFVDDRCVLAWRASQTLHDVTWDGDVLVRTPVAGGAALRETVALEGDRLVLVAGGGAPRTFERLDRLPHRTRIEPFPLGEETPAPARLADIVADLLVREQRDQDVRRRLGDALAAARAEHLPHDPAAFQHAMTEGEAADVLREMAAIDQENTRQLIGYVLDHGWIDVARFGRPAHHAAFLLVQHSGHLGLMRTVLPLLEEEARADPAIGQSFALLHDRTQLALGGLQRYGTQLTTDPDGTLRVHRLEEPGSVDARRATVGLPPHEEYLALFRADGTTVVVGDAPAPVRDAPAHDDAPR